MQNTAVAQNGKQNSQVRGSNGSNTNKNRSSTHNYRHNNSINEGNNRKSSSANFQGSERQRMLYIERESYCAVEVDLKRTWEHPQSRHFGIPFWESHAFDHITAMNASPGDPASTVHQSKPREPFGVKALDLESDKFRTRRHFPQKQGLTNITYM
ncbi:uncharacterized protein LOC142335425 [Convolutriloba macropyga]|uniref:uncharacterized protein LOC142335425 n=1 Tax=Convolutriloba macropyga TaxID=536237 RepID=UPI003F523885